MNRTTQTEPTYVIGRSEAETHRLMVQAQLYGQVTRRFLEDAGLTPGMKVLDVGSGAGDVAFTAAEIAGPSGSVVGVDVNGAILGTARERAQQERRDNVVFVEGDCRTAALDDFDAAVGRFVLMYTGDVTEALRTVAARVRPGGIVAFAEADFSSVRGLYSEGRNCGKGGVSGAALSLAPPGPEFGILSWLLASSGAWSSCGPG